MLLACCVGFKGELAHKYNSYFFYYALIVIIFESFSSFIKNRLQY
ncbi:hypothetical protein HMPREF1572_00920 [Gardnerella vaginalis JCP7275]|nr:hypothetical protein HMPREF1572_00920 [Gardnerella vaginalis JCP7275]